jgi:hypothetical protein
MKRKDRERKSRMEKGRFYIFEDQQSADAFEKMMEARRKISGKTYGSGGCPTKSADPGETEKTSA